MFTSLDRIPVTELAFRQRRCLDILDRTLPEAGGLLVFSGINIFYLAGTAAIGVLWLPKQGEPVLAVRKGTDRAGLENPGLKVVRYRSYGDLARLMAGAGSPLTRDLAIQEGALSWTMGKNFAKNFQDYTLRPADQILTRTRSVKTAFELEIIRQAGKLHYESASLLLPEIIRPGMSEDRIAREQIKIFMDRGHTGLLRMAGTGEEPFLVKVASGVNGTYPTYSTGPLGAKGLHQTAMYMGDRATAWQPGTFVAIDSGFVLDGYNTDKTQLYFAGKPGQIPDAARKAQECCIKIQAELAARLKPGFIPEDLYKLSLKIADEAGFASGYMGLGADQQPYMGHGIGLQVDEWPVIAGKFTDPLEENMVIALEPKISVPGIFMAGVENNFIVTPEGGKSLTTKTENLADDNGDFICIE